jgi:hypothetical protein
MNAKHSEYDVEMNRLIDRLVCDELDEPARARLLGWLDEEPRRWRSCALAFLESQTWTRSLAPCEPALATDPVVTRACAPLSRDEQATAKRRWRNAGRTRATLRRAAATAAVGLCLLAAFALGASLREMVSPAPMSHAPDHPAADNTGAEPTRDSPEIKIDRDAAPVLASVSMRPDSGSGPRTTVHIPVAPLADAAAAPGLETPEIPEYVRKQWERRGYQLDTERRYLFATLPSGKTVVVPIEQLYVKQVRAEIN